MIRSRLLAVGALVLAPALLASAQSPLRYALRVDTADLSAVSVEIRIPAARDTVRVAMATHDEYDDRYWRYVRDLRVESNGAPLDVTRADSASWLITGAGAEVTVRYRLALPPDSGSEPRRSWRAALGPTGGLVGGIDCFMYLPDRPDLTATVSLDLPAGWRVATGLTPNADSTLWHAADAATLLDSPILVGRVTFKRARNASVAFLAAPSGTAFDTAAFVHVIDTITTQAIAIFGSAPYHDYTFLFLDSTRAGLEHVNSIVWGISSAELARDPAYYAAVFAHEFFHTWNLIRLHPAGLRALRSGATPRVAELWWSEGMTIFFADEILQRAGRYGTEHPRDQRLAARIARYLTNPGYTHVSPERASLTAGLPPGTNGDYSGDYYLSGQLTGDMLELIIRDSTKGARGMDDVIRALYAHSAGEPGYTRAEIIRAADEGCGCELRPFLERHVADATAFDFDAALRGVGLHTVVAYETAHDSSGAPLPDTRVFAIRAEGAPPDSPLRIGITRPTGAWAAAGLHSGDELLAVDGHNVTSWTDFRRLLATFKVGQKVTVLYSHYGRRLTAHVLIDVYVIPTVTLEPIPDAPPAALALRARWLAAAP